MESSTTVGGAVKRSGGESGGPVNKRPLVVSFMKGRWGVKIVPGQMYLYNKSSLPIHPWGTNRFGWEEQGFRSLQHWIGVETVEAFKLGDKHRGDVLGARSAWGAVQALPELPGEPEKWEELENRLREKLPGVLEKIARRNKGFVEHLLGIEEPLIGFCTPNRMLGTGVDLAKGEAWELYSPSCWVGHNLLGKALVEIRARLRTGELQREWEEEEEGEEGKKLIPEWQEPEGFGCFDNDEINATGAGSQIPPERQGPVVKGTKGGRGRGKK